MSTVKVPAELMEELAAIEHERWADWQRYLHDSGTRVENGTQQGGALILPQDRVNHWERQIATPYTELSEREKQSDRGQVERYWPVIEAWLNRHGISTKEGWPRVFGWTEGGE